MSKKRESNQFKVTARRIEDELSWKFKMGNSEIEELKTNLNYLENKLVQELNVKEELTFRAEQDRKELIDYRRKLKEQEDVNKTQAKQISALSDQLSEFVNSQDNIVKHLKDKFDDYNKEIKEKDDKIYILKNQLLDSNNKLMLTTKDRDRYLKELEIAEQNVIQRDEQIKRLTTELSLAEKTIEEFINVKERDIKSFFQEDTIYTDPKKIESILSNLDDTKKEYSQLGKGDDSKLIQCRPYLVQKMKQEELKKKGFEMEKEFDLTKLPQQIRKIVDKYRTTYSPNLDSSEFDRMLFKINRSNNEIIQDRVAKVKSQANAEIQYLKRLLGLLIPLDKDKARTEIAYLRSELKRAREDIRRLNIVVKKKFKDFNGYDSLSSQKQRNTLGDDGFNDVSTQDGMYKSNSRFIENALSLAENAVNETKGLNTKISHSVNNFQNKKSKNYSTWREEDEPEDMLSEEWLISEINNALKDSNKNVQRMMHASRLHLENSGMHLMK